MTPYVDTHCHLDLFPDPIDTLKRAPGTVVVAVTELPSGYRKLRALFRSDWRVRVALGLHPLRASSAGPYEKGQLIRLLQEADYVGEVGLDFSQQGRDSRGAQLDVFERLVAEPILRNKVLTVHSRGAERDTIRLLEQARVPAILHWYSGPPALIDQALAAGLYFSVNPAMLRTKNGQTTIAALPHDRVLTESDGPYATARGHVAGPSDMPWLVGEVAGQWETDPGEALSVLHRNMARLFAATVGDAATAGDEGRKQ